MLPKVGVAGLLLMEGEGGLQLTVDVASQRKWAVVGWLQQWVVGAVLLKVGVAKLDGSWHCMEAVVAQTTPWLGSQVDIRGALSHA